MLNKVLLFVLVLSSACAMPYRLAQMSDEEAVVANIMGTLQPTIDATIAQALAAMRANRQATVTTQQQTSGATVRSQADLVIEIVQTIEPEILHCIQETLASSQFSGLFQSQSTGSTSSAVSSSSSSGSAQTASMQSQLVQQIIVALTPQIAGAVEAATASTSQVFTQEVVEGSGIEAGSISTTIVQEQEQQQSTINEASIVEKIISALTPQITASVSSAVTQLSSTSSSDASSSSSTSSNVQQVEVQEVHVQQGVSSGDLTQQVLTALTPSVSAAIQAAMAGQTVTTTVEQQSSLGQTQQAAHTGSSQTSQTSFSTGVQETQVHQSSQADIVKQIILALTPQISAAVQGATSQNQGQGVVQSVQVSGPTAQVGQVSTSFSTGGASSSSSQQSASNSFSHATLIQQIMKALRPQIQASIQNIITTSSRAPSPVPVSITTTTVEQLPVQTVTTIHGAGGHGVVTTGGSSTSQTSFSSSGSGSSSQSNLMAQIIAALRPGISAAVQNAVTAGQTVTVSQSVVPVSQSVVPVSQTGLAISSASSDSSSASSSSASSSSSQSLQSIFGTGEDAHNVRIETPLWSTEYRA